MQRWPAFHQPALDWLDRIERAIRAHDHPEQGAFIALTNAIECQFENGAYPDTVRTLLTALTASASASGIKPASIGLDDDPDRLLARLAPGSRPTG